MKKRIILLMAISLSALSCQEEDITYRPLTAVNEATVLKSIGDFQNAIRGSYVYMRTDAGYAGEFLIDTEVMTDNLIYNPGGRGTNLNGFRWLSTPNNSHFDYLEESYRPADMASRVINNIGNIPVSAERNNIEGEARFIRALTQFDAVRIYSKIPTQSSDALGSLGMYYLKTFEPFARPSRPTVQETYNEILEDLLSAKDLIGNNSVTSGRASKSTVYALLSRVYLYMGDYAKVAEYGQLALDNAVGEMGNLAGPIAAPTPPATTPTVESDFVKVWDDVSVKGVLLKLPIRDTDQIIPGNSYFQGSPNARKSEYVASKELADLYKSTDIRKDTYIANSKYAGKFFNHIIKYDGRPGGVANVVDIKILRMEEVLLNMAEAEYRLSGGGLATLDMLRSKRYTDYAPGTETGQALLDAILLERRLEFAFEMDRFFTLKRLGMDMTRSTTDGQISDGSGTAASPTFIAADDYRWQLPIPKYYRDANPNYQQNPGY